MGLFTRMSMLKKIVNVTQIPKELLECKSDAEIYGNSLYYLNKGKNLLSVIKNPGNNQLEVIERLNSMGDYFKLNYNNLFVEKGTNKLLGVVYTFDVSFKKDKIKMSEVFEDERLKKVFSENEKNAFESVKGALTHVLFFHEVLKHLYKNGISVNSIDISSVKEYGETYSEKYINVMNFISKLEMSNGKNENENADILWNTFHYLYAIDDKIHFINNVSSRVKKYIEGYSSCASKEKTEKFARENDFSSVLIEEIESLAYCDVCGKEFDVSLKRCPSCNNLDRFVSSEELTNIKLQYLQVEDENFELYAQGGILTMLFKNLYDDHQIDQIIEFITLNVNDLKYGFLYDSNSNIIGFELNSSNISTLENKVAYTIEEYLDMLIYKEKLNDDISILSNLFLYIYQELEDIKMKKFNFSTQEEYEKKFLIFGYNIYKNFGAVFTKPTEIVCDEYAEFDPKKVALTILFEYCQKKFNSRIENGKIVSDSFDIMKLFNYELVLEYVKFLEGKDFESEKIKYLKYIREYDKYDSSYQVSPKLCDIIMYDEFKKDVSKYKDYTLVKTSISEVELEPLYQAKRDISKLGIEANLPEYIIYKFDEYTERIVYEGYLIKNTDGIINCARLFEGNIKKYNNKEILGMLLTLIETCQKLKACKGNWYRNVVIPKNLCYNKDFSVMCLQFNPLSNDRTRIDEYLEELVKEISKDIYLADTEELFSKITKENVNNIRDIYNSLENYCETHKIWYENSYKRCPICEKYNFYIETKKISKRKLYENSLYTCIPYKKNYAIKLFKLNDGKLANGMTPQEVEENTISILKRGNTVLKKVVKDYETEETVGILVDKERIRKGNSLDFILNKYDNSNKSFLEQAIYILRNLSEKDLFIFASFGRNKYSIKSFVKNNIFISRNKLDIFDYEFISEYASSFVSKEEGLNYLDKLVKYILSYDKRCIEFDSIVYPKVDLEYIDNLLQILGKFEKYLSESTVKLCTKHSVYYNSKDGGCPVCIEEMDEILLKGPEDSYMLPPEKTSPVSQGAEAKVYKLGTRKLLKMYIVRKPDDNCDPDKVDELRRVLLEDYKQAMERRKDIIEDLLKLNRLTKEDLKNKNFKIIFPEKGVYVTERRVFKGFTQEKVKDKISFATLLNKDECKKLGFNKIEDILKLLIYYGEAIEYMHNSPIIRSIIPSGIVVGDISGRNALYSLYDNKVALIDTDSVGTNKAPCVMYTGLFADPINIRQNKNASFDSDWYAYAVLCFFALTRVHPFGGTYKSKPSMEIEERMKEKISVIGKKAYNITVPDIVVEWDWMPKNLLNAFLDMFEKGKRYSILKILKETYNLLTRTNEFSLDDITEIQDVPEDEIEYVKEEEISEENFNLDIEEIDSRNITSPEIIKDDNIYYKDGKRNLLLCRKDLSTFNLHAGNIVSDEFLVEDSYVDENQNGIAIVIKNDRKYIVSVKNNSIINVIYKMSDCRRKFMILYDWANEMYLLISTNNTKSYVVKNEKVLAFDKVYNGLELGKYIELEKLEKACFSFNALYYPENGYIVRFDLCNKDKKKIYISSDIATEDSNVKVFSQGFIIINEEGIFKVSNRL